MHSTAILRATSGFIPDAPARRESGKRDAEVSPGLAPLLQVDDVSLEYRTRERVVRATHRVSFDVHDGDRFVLLGPSGCGKSTLLKAVAGFILRWRARFDWMVKRSLRRVRIALSLSLIHI